jgi:hypothetical protein
VPVYDVDQVVVAPRGELNFGNLFWGMGVDLDPTCHNTRDVTIHSYIFSSGGRSVNMWVVNQDVLQAKAELGGDGVEPFCEMIEGGR